MIAKKDYRELVKGHDYSVTGIHNNIDGEQYYQVVLGKRIVLYHVSHFEAYTVDEDEF